MGMGTWGIAAVIPKNLSLRLLSKEPSLCYEKEGKDLILKQDVEFNSPSGAAVFCVGGSENGWTKFKDENGKELIAYRKVQAEKG